MAVSFAIDAVEMEILGVNSNHGKRVGYIAIRMAEVFGLSQEEIFDLLSLSIMHDNAISEELLKSQPMIKTMDNFQRVETLMTHCSIGEKNIRKFPFLTSPKSIITYHHENYDGSGFFGLKGQKIPLMAQIISFADFTDFLFSFDNQDINNREKIIDYVKEQKGKRLSPDIVEAFLENAQYISFWLDLQNHNINDAIGQRLPSLTKELSWYDIFQITDVFSNIIDCKSKFTQWHSIGLNAKASILAKHYGKDEEEQIKLSIAANVHDLGKLTIPNSILDKPDKLTKAEFSVIQTHTYYTRYCLKDIKPFNEITEWAANHHEKLDGGGYPYGFKADRLDFNSRMICCLDIYQALTEERPYRKELPHEQAMDILRALEKNGQIDSLIVNDIDKVFEDIIFYKSFYSPFSG